MKGKKSPITFDFDLVFLNSVVFTHSAQLLDFITVQ